jgi:hypothetical protein
MPPPGQQFCLGDPFVVSPRSLVLLRVAAQVLRPEIAEGLRAAVNRSCNGWIVALLDADQD